MTKSKFYKNVSLYLTLGLLVVFWGFSKSYFFQLSANSPAHHVHGISATLWMVVLIVQPYLYKINKLKIHRYIGWSTLFLVPTLVIAGYFMMKRMVHNQAYYPPNTVYKLAFIDFFTLLGFSLLYFLAIYFRKNIKLHARFMACTIFGPLIPAITRIFFYTDLASNFNQSLTYSYLVIEIVLLFIIWRERKYREMKFTYLPVFLYTVFQHVCMYSVENWSWFVDFINGITLYPNI